eukprot:3032557-Prymnesium_polylepis.1
MQRSRLEVDNQTADEDDRPPSRYPVGDRLSCSTSQPVAGGAAEPVAGGQPVSIMTNVSGDLLDGGAELHHLTDDVNDRASSLDDDEQCAAGDARSALALLARLVGVGESGGSASGMVCRVTGQL